MCICTLDIQHGFILANAIYQKLGLEKHLKTLISNPRGIRIYFRGMNILHYSFSALCGLVFAGFLFGSCGHGSSTTTAHNAPNQQVTELSILLLDSLQQAHPDAILLDVRSDEEWALGHLSQAAYISFDWDHRLEPLRELPANRPVFVYCEAGGRSGVITEELRIIGHPHIVDLIGGMEAWLEAGKDVAFGEPVSLP